MSSSSGSYTYGSDSRASTSGGGGSWFSRDSLSSHTRRRRRHRAASVDLEARTSSTWCPLCAEAPFVRKRDIVQHAHDIREAFLADPTLDERGIHERIAMHKALECYYTRIWRHIAHTYPQVIAELTSAAVRSLPRFAQAETYCRASSASVCTWTLPAVPAYPHLESLVVQMPWRYFSKAQRQRASMYVYRDVGYRNVLVFSYCGTLCDGRASPTLGRRRPPLVCIHRPPPVDLRCVLARIDETRAELGVAVSPRQRLLTLHGKRTRSLSLSHKRK